MKLLDLLNYVIVAVVLLAIGWVIKKAELWNYYHTISMPYLCSAIALSLLVVASTALVFQKPTSEIPGMAAAIFCGVIIILMVYLFSSLLWKLEQPVVPDRHIRMVGRIGDSGFSLCPAAVKIELIMLLSLRGA